MTPEIAAALLVSVVCGGLGLFFIGILACKAKPAPKPLSMRLQKGTHLPNSRYDESNFGH